MSPVYQEFFDDAKSCGASDPAAHRYAREMTNAYNAEFAGDFEG